MLDDLIHFDDWKRRDFFSVGKMASFNRCNEIKYKNAKNIHWKDILWCGLYGFSVESRTNSNPQWNDVVPKINSISCNPEIIRQLRWMAVRTSEWFVVRTIIHIWKVTKMNYKFRAINFEFQFTYTRSNIISKMIFFNNNVIGFKFEYDADILFFPFHNSCETNVSICQNVMQFDFDQQQKMGQAFFH